MEKETEKARKNMGTARSRERGKSVGDTGGNEGLLMLLLLV